LSFDTKYRPRKFADVLGQESTIQILRQFIRTGAAFQQSYLFAGKWGSGKTTLGRILAMALLCESPQDGEPCGECTSCRTILETGASESFLEVDAATNSGKADIKRITEEIAYSTFSGKRRLYLFDESHQLSKDALDAMLKPLEETAPGSEDKKLVCIFATTEPEKMRTTILSRCAPAFIIETLTPEVIAGRLAYVCEQEGIEHDPEVLPLIAEITECHVRDALKALEGVSMLGPVNRENVASYLHLNLQGTYLDLMEALDTSLGDTLAHLRSLMDHVSPGTCYERLTHLCMMAYKVRVGVAKPPVYWEQDRVKALGERLGDKLVVFASMLSSRLGRPTPSMLECDVIHLHRMARGEEVALPTSAPPMAVAPAAPVATPPEPNNPKKEPSSAKLSKKEVDGEERLDQNSSDTANMQVGSVVTKNGVNVVPRAVRQTKRPEPVAASPSTFELPPSTFAELLALRVAELRHEGRRGFSGPTNMGSP